MSKTEYQPETSGGPLWTAFVIVICLILFLHFAPMVLLGGAGVLLWRWTNHRHPLGKRHLLALLALSLLPAFLVSHLASGNPLLGYFDAQQDVLNAGVRRAFGRDDTFDAGMTLFGYLGQVLPTWLPGAVICGTVIGRLTRPKKSPLRVREATGVDVPRRVEKKLARGLCHPSDGWAIGYTPEGQQVAIGDLHARQHVVVCGATGAGKTTVLRHLLDGVAGRCPLVIVDCKASRSLRAAVEGLPNGVVWTIGGPPAGPRGVGKAAGSCSLPTVRPISSPRPSGRLAHRSPPVAVPTVPDTSQRRLTHLRPAQQQPARPRRPTPVGALRLRGRGPRLWLAGARSDTPPCNSRHATWPCWPTWRASTA
jgi:hypothetical protein